MCLWRVHGHDGKVVAYLHNDSPVYIEGFNKNSNKCKSLHLLPCVRALNQSDCRISRQNHLSSFGVTECTVEASSIYRSQQENISIPHDPTMSHHSTKFDSEVTWKCSSLFHMWYFPRIIIMYTHSSGLSSSPQENICI